MKKLLCRLGLHPKAPALDGGWPFPIHYNCPWCKDALIDYGPPDH